MAFEVPASKASKGQDKFEFSIGGKTYSVKKMKFLSVGEAELLESGESMKVFLDLFGERGTKSGDAVRSLDQEQLAALIQAWNEDSGIESGESQAS